MLRWFVVATTGDLGRTVLLVHPAALVVVGVLVALAVAEPSRSVVAAVSEPSRHRARGHTLHVLAGPAECDRDPVRLRRRGEVHDGLGQVEARLGQADELDGPRRGVGDDERQGIAHADVLAGEDHQPSGNEASVLPRLQHPRQPVQACVGVGAPDALDEGADDVVVVVLPVPERPGPPGRLGVGERHPRPCPGRARFPTPGESEGDLQGVEDHAGVAIGLVDEMLDGVVVGLTALPGERPAHQLPKVIGSQRVQTEQARAAHERRVDLEERVLGRGADQDERAVLDRREQRILLRLVEAVDLVEEQDRPLSLLGQAPAGPVDDFAYVFHARRHGRERDERLLAALGDQPGERRLPRPRRPPQDDRGQPVGLDQGAQRGALAQQVVLAHHLVERAGAQPGRQRRLPGQAFLQGGIEELGPVRPGTRRHLAGGAGPLRMPSSAIAWRSSALGAPVIGSAPDWVFGKAMTSRMFSSRASTATNRSIPRAKPP